MCWKMCLVRSGKEIAHESGYTSCSSPACMYPGIVQHWCQRNGAHHLHCAWLTGKCLPPGLLYDESVRRQGAPSFLLTGVVLSLMHQASSADNEGAGSRKSHGLVWRNGNRALGKVAEALAVHEASGSRSHQQSCVCCVQATATCLVGGCPVLLLSLHLHLCRTP